MSHSGKNTILNGFLIYNVNKIWVSNFLISILMHIEALEISFFISSKVKETHRSWLAGRGYRNWPRYGLRWSGWYCSPAQHELCRPSRAGQHNECCAGLQYQPRQRRPYKWSISILPRSQFNKKHGKLAFSTFCTAIRPHRRLRNDAWRRDR